MKYLILLLPLLTLNACVTAEKHADPGLTERVFNAPYDQVWRATELALARYPRKIDDIEAGILETEMMKGEQPWDPPLMRERKGSGYRQRIQIRVIKGDDGGRPAVKVVVTKTGEILHNFFSEAEKVESDGVEERLILYRVDRELKIDQAIQRSVKRKKPAEMDDEK